MKTRLQQIGVLLLPILLLAFLVTGAYGTSSKNLPAGKKMKNPKQTVGKNWEAKTNTIEAKGVPRPKKTLKSTMDPAQDKKAVEQRLQPSNDGLDPIMSTK